MAGGGDFFAVLLMLLMTISGGNANNDLLDLIPSNAYWAAKEVNVTAEQLLADVNAAPPGGDAAKLAKELMSLSRRDAARKQLEAMGGAAVEALRSADFGEDPEAAQMARDLIKRAGTTGKAADVRRLMAIRALGERKEASAVAVLKTLATSDEMFVADYANRALAQIEGRPVKVVDHKAKLAADLGLLPSTTGIVGQTTGLVAPGLSLDTLIKLAEQNPAPADEAAMLRQRQNLARMRHDLVTQLISYAEQTGNVRADGATIAVSADIGGGANEWFMVIVHGQFDRRAIADIVAQQGRNRFPVENRGEAVIVPLDREARVAMPSDRHFILAAANPANTPLQSILDPLLDAVAGKGPGTFAENKELAALANAADKSGPLWAVAIPSARMKREALFAPFNALTLSSHDDGKNVTLTVKTGPAPDAQGAIRQFESVRGDMLRQLRQAVTQLKDLQPLLDGADSVTVVTDEKTAVTTATARVTRDVGPMLMLSIGQMMGVMPRAPMLARDLP